MTKGGKEGRHSLFYSTLFKEINARYGFEVRQWRRKGNDVLIVTDQGLKKICCAQGSTVADLLFTLAATEYMAANGFNRVSHVYPTIANEPFFSFADNLYYVVDWYEGKHLNYASLPEARKAALCLGEFHLVSHGFEPPPGCAIRKGWGRWLTDWEQQYLDLEVFHVQALQRKNQGDIESLLACTLDFSLKQAEYSLSLLYKADYFSLVVKAMEEKVLCHSHWDQDVLISNKNDKVYVTDFSFCRYEVISYDLTFFLRKALKKQKNKNEACQTLLHSFSQVRRLLPEEIACTIAGLCFPYKVWRLGDRYYRRKTVLSGEKWADKIREALEQQRVVWELAQGILSHMRW